MVRLLIIVLCFMVYAPNASAQTDSTKVFTEQNPLVFESSSTLWPYSFLNDNNEPEGYCIDLIKVIMRELNIPCVIKLKPHQEALNNLKAGEADLTLGLNNIYDIKYGYFGKSSVTLLTQSVATPKGEPLAIKSFRDLKTQTVIVSDSSLCHHLMVDYGWSANAIASDDIRKTIQEVNDKKNGQIVWNTLSLQWLVNHYHLDNLTVTPVNMPHGEVRFLATDSTLLGLIDKTYLNLCANDMLEPLEEKWFYPHHEPSETSSWHWFLAGAALLLLIITIIFFVREILQNRRSATNYHQMTQQLANLAHYNKVRIWTYDIREQKFEWHDESGMAVKTYTIEEFAMRYSKADFALLEDALERIGCQHKDAKGHEIIEDTLELKAKDEEYGDSEPHGFVVHLSVLSRDDQGKPMVIIGTKKDVTKERQLKQVNAERSLRYLSVFYNNETGIIYFDKDGYMQNANPKSGELLQIDIDKAVKNHVHLNTLFHTGITDMANADGKDDTLTFGDNELSYHMKAVFNDDQKIIGLFVFCV